MIKGELMYKKNKIGLLLTVLFFTTIDARVRPNGSRLWDFAKETIEQEADYIITQADIPLTILLPGVYRLAEPLTLAGGTVITIDANDVVLDLNGKVISGDTIALSIAAGRSNIIIQNGFILGAPLLQNALVVNAGCSFILVQNIECHNFSGQGLAAFILQSSNNIFFDHCTVADSQTVLLSAATVNQLQIKNCFFRNNQANSALFLSGVSRSLIADTVIQGVGTGINLAQGNNNVIESCVVAESSNTGYNITNGFNNLVKNCFATGIASIEGSAYGFRTTDGRENIFEGSIANNIVTQSIIDGDIVAGFSLRNEQCSKIIGSEAYNIRTPIDGFSNAYGINLFSMLDPLVTKTISITQGFRVSTWDPNADFLAANALTGTPDLLLFSYNRAKEELVLTDTLAIPSVGNSIAWAPGGLYIAYSSGTDVSVVQFDRVNQKFGSITATNNHGAFVTGVAWSADGRFLAISGSLDVGNVGIRIYQFNLITGALTLVQSVVQPPDGFLSIAWHPSGNFFAAGDAGGNVFLYSFDKNINSYAVSLLATQTPGGGITAIDWSFDGNYLVVSSSNATITVYQFDPIALTITQVAQAVVGGASVPFVQWSADGKFVVTGDNTGISVYSFSRQFNNLNLEQSFALVGTGFAQWSPDGARIAAENNANLYMLTGLTFPQKNIIQNNISYCAHGSLLQPAVGVSGSSSENLIDGNLSYANDFNYQFVTNVYNQGLTGAPTLLQNIAIPPI